MPIYPNFVKLEPGECHVFIFDDMWVENRKIRDPKSGRIKTVTAYVLHIVKLDGLECDKTLSILSYKAQQYLDELKRKGWLFGRPIKICCSGEDFYREYIFELL